MFFLHPRHSDFHHSQLLHPSFAYMLANPEERMKCHPKTSPSRRCHFANDSSRGFSNSHMHVLEEDERFLLYTDLPGVKAEDLTVELTNKGLLRIHGQRKRGDAEEPLKFDRKFLVDEKLLESSKITATFSDGSLEIVAPKKQATKPRRVAVVAGSPPSTSDGEAVRSFDVDVPGVKIDALQVEVDDDGKLAISGERKRGGKTVAVRRAFAMDTNFVDTNKLETFLEDGVLTIRVPVKAPRVGRVIPVNATLEDNASEQVKAKENAATAPSVAAVGTANEDIETIVHANKSDDEAEAADQEESDSTKGHGEEFYNVQAEEELSNGETDKVETKATNNEEKESSDLEFEVVPETVTEED